jgi:hypothetical protein
VAQPLVFLFEALYFSLLLLDLLLGPEKLTGAIG